MKQVIFDLETDDKYPATAQIIQIAAVAVDGEFSELDSFSRLVQFDVSKASPEALKINHYDPEKWAANARPVASVLADFCAWSRPYHDQVRTSKAGNPYKIGTLCGYNAATFDGPILKRECERLRMFLPCDPRVRDAFHVAMAACDFLGADLPNYKLATVAEYFGAPVENAHDALSDVRTTVALMRRFRDIFIESTRKAAA